MWEVISDKVHLFRDTCNVYAITDGDAALLVDAGSGSAQAALPELGCRRVEWVLHTHHHRDQCWGDRALVREGARIAVPEFETHLFDKVELFWQSRRIFDNYDNRSNFFTLDRSIPVAAALRDYEDFSWRGYRFFVLPAKGHTQGSSALITVIDKTLFAFTGDLLVKGGRLYQLHAMEYRYGDMAGALFTLESLQALREVISGDTIAGRIIGNWERAVILPSHGDVIDDPVADIERLARRIVDLAYLGRGLRVGGRDSVPEPLYMPEPRYVPVSEHLLWSGPWTCAFFYVVLSQTGAALFIDYGASCLPHMHVSADHSGLEVVRFVEHHLKQLRRDYNVTTFELAVPTHAHDDHTCGIPHLQKYYGTQCFALKGVAEILARPAVWASAPCTYYKPIRIGRTLADGEEFQWHEHRFRVYSAPGQAECHSMLTTELDGRRIAFTGDNCFLHEVLEGSGTVSRAYQTTVFRNGFRFAMHRRCAEVMREAAPQLICPGHKGLLPCDEALITEYVDFIKRKEMAFRGLVGEPHDQYVDLFWARLLPYLLEVPRNEDVEYTLRLRNNLGHDAFYEARLLPPEGWTVASEFAGLELAADEAGSLALFARSPTTPDPARRLVVAEIRIDGVSQGAVAEALVVVSD